MTEALRPLQKLLQVGIDDLMPDPSQPRKTFLADEIERLSSSIGARGVLIPLLVLRDEEPRMLADRDRRKSLEGSPERLGLTRFHAWRSRASRTKRTYWLTG